MSIFSARNVALAYVVAQTAACAVVVPGTEAVVTPTDGGTRCTSTGSVTPYQVKVDGNTYRVEATTNKSGDVVVTGFISQKELLRSVVHYVVGTPVVTATINGGPTSTEVDRRAVFTAHVAHEATRAAKKTCQGTSIGMTSSLQYNFG